MNGPLPWNPQLSCSYGRRWPRPPQPRPFASFCLRSGCRSDWPLVCWESNWDLSGYLALHYELRWFLSQNLSLSSLIFGRHLAVLDVPTLNKALDLRILPRVKKTFVDGALSSLTGQLLLPLTVTCKRYRIWKDSLAFERQKFSSRMVYCKFYQAWRKPLSMAR